MGSQKVDGTGSSRAPDGGWGWIVCLACFFSHVLTDGMFYSFGIMFVELLDYFKGSKGETAIIASLAPSLCYISGWLYDISGGYIISYVSAGLSIVFSGAILYVIPLLKTTHQSYEEFT